MIRTDTLRFVGKTYDEKECDTQKWNRSPLGRNCSEVSLLGDTQNETDRRWVGIAGRCRRRSVGIAGRCRREASKPWTSYLQLHTTKKTKSLFFQKSPAGGFFLWTYCIFSANFWWIFFRISRQIPENSDVCRFFNQIYENKSEIGRKFWILWKKITIIVNYSLRSLVQASSPCAGCPRIPSSSSGASSASGCSRWSWRLRARTRPRPPE